MLIRCTKSQVVHLGPLSFLCVCSGKTSRRRSIVPCGIDDSDLEALRADNASFYRQKSTVSDTDRQRTLPNTSIMVARMTTRFSAMLIFLSILGLEPQPIQS